MAIDTTRLATRLGHLIASLNEVNSYRGSTLPDRVTTLEADYASVNPSLISDLTNQENASNSSLDGWVTYLSTFVTNVIITEVTNDKVLPNADITHCLVEWVRQMVIAADSFNVSTCTLGSVTDVGSPTSHTQWLTSAKDGTGVVQDLIVPDDYLIKITADDQRGGTKYAEGYTITGKAANLSLTEATYPTGTGIDTQYQIIDPAVDDIALNANFESWAVANTPDDWIVVAPSIAGTNVFKVADDARTGADGFSLKLLSTASGTVKVRQDITSSLKPNTVYGVHFKQSPIANGSATASACAVTVSLVDGSGTVIEDDASTSNSLVGSTHAVVTISSGWNNGYQKVFITPKTLPSTVYLEISQAADAAGCEDHIDHMCLVQLSPLYAGGPYFEGFSALVRAAQGDAWTWDITLDGSDAITSYIVRGLDRFLNLKALGIRLPTSGSPTQADSLIT